MLHQYRRDERGALEMATAAITLAREQQFPFWEARAMIVQGWALTRQEQSEEGLFLINQGETAYHASGAELLRPYSLILLAEGYGKVGQAEKGLAALAEARALVDKTGERFYEAEMYRLKGELTMQKLSVVSSQLSVPDAQRLTPSTQAEVEQEAEGHFLKAIDIAQKQQAKSLELRASTSLTRLWQSQGKKAEAHKLLSDVYSWFTEGFDTKDLQEAKELLQSLESGV